MSAKEVEARRVGGYFPGHYYQHNPVIKRSADALLTDFAPDNFFDLFDMLTRSDYYMTLADFDDYRRARERSGQLYRDKYLWQKMAVRNIAESAIFCADRAINNYAEKIWGLR